MNSVIYDFIKKYQPISLELKREFKIVEKKEWDALTFWSEYCVQLSHLFYVVTEKNSIKGITERHFNLDDIEDEVSDLFFQLLIFIYHMKFQISEDSFISINQCDELIELNDLLYAAVVLSGDIFDMLLRLFDYKDLANNIKEKMELSIFNKIRITFIVLIKITNIFHIDIYNAFDTMVISSRKYLSSLHVPRD